MFGRTRFLDGFEVHFLCEYTGYWHMTEDAGFSLGTPPQLQRATASTGGSAASTGKRTTQAASASTGGVGGGSQVAVLLNLALSFVQVSANTTLFQHKHVIAKIEKKLKLN